jgi:hypothetical protein
MITLVLLDIIKKFGARDAIRMHELLQDQALNLVNLTWLGNSRKLVYSKIRYSPLWLTLKNV